LKVVLDTNIWISGLLLPKSKAGKILAAWQASRFEVVTSQEILDEIKKVLLYPKIQKRIEWSEAKANQYILLLKFLTHLVAIDPKYKKIKVPNDANDSAILQTFLTSHADYLVTGDNDLLILNLHYPIITLNEFYEITC
jgi:putative PIN family toxin of toxin-antitoxin system